MTEITRARGDNTAVAMDITANGVDLTEATAITMAVYDTQKKTTLIETLTGEKRGFDPRTFFPILDADWDGTRWWQVTITFGAESMPLPELYKWTQT